MLRLFLFIYLFVSILCLYAVLIKMVFFRLGVLLLQVYFSVVFG